MIIAITYQSGSGIDRNVTQFHEEYVQEEDRHDLVVTYEDGSTARYERGTVTDAWHDEETHQDYQ